MYYSGETSPTVSDLRRVILCETPGHVKAAAAASGRITARPVLLPESWETQNGSLCVTKKNKGPQISHYLLVCFVFNLIYFQHDTLPD